jgi:hypothetical protein
VIWLEHSIEVRLIAVPPRYQKPTRRVAADVSSATFEVVRPEAWMRRRVAILAAIIAPIATALGCGYPDFTFGPADGGTGSTGGSTTSASGTGGAATTTSSSAAGTGGAAAASSTAASSAVSSAASSTSASSGSPGCAIGHLLISEIRTHGPGGLADEFVELYNATPQDVLLDSLWTLEARAVDPGVSSYTARWKGKGFTVPAYGHYLITGSSAAYTGPLGDDTLANGLTDGASLRLMHNGGAVDAVCYYHANDPTMAANFIAIPPYTCESFPVANPHDGTNGTDTDISLERPAGGTLGNCTDSDNNFADFQMQSPSTPLGTLDAPTP